MSKENKELIGYIGVDAGIVWIGDPCYILHQENKGDKEELEKVIGKTWHEFCDKLSDTEVATKFPYPLGREGLGICVGRFGGDGTYPVYAIKDTHDVVSQIIIDFAGDEE